MESNSFQNKLPDDLHSEILTYLSQYDLCNLSLTNKYWYGIAVRKLYYHILILTNCSFPRHYYESATKFIERSYTVLPSGTIVISVANINKLIKTLKHNRKLINYIRMFGLHHWIDTEIDIDKIKFQLFDLVSSSINLKTFGGMFKFDDNDFVKFFTKDEIREKLTTLYLTNLNQLFKPSFPQSLTSLNMELHSFDNLVGDIDLSSPNWSWFYQIRELNINTKNNLGFIFLKKFKLNKFKDKLKLKSLSITHLHSPSLSLIEENHEIITKVKNDINYHSLNFQDLNNLVDLNGLKNLNLKIDCHCDHPHDNDLTCFRKFFQDYNNHCSSFKNLKNLIIETFENSTMLGPRIFVSNYLDPLLSFIIKCDNLDSLTLNFDNPGLQFYENIYTDDILKIINEAIFHFIKILKIPLKNLKCLILPDFILSFTYFSKFTFLEGFLKNCNCDGCEKTLKNLRSNLIDSKLSSDAQEHRMVEILANIMGMLQFKRELYKPSRFTNDFNKFPIFSDWGNSLHSFYHEPKNIVPGTVDIGNVANNIPNLALDEIEELNDNRGYIDRQLNHNEMLRNIIQRQVEQMNMEDDQDQDQDHIHLDNNNDNIDEHNHNHNQTNIDNNNNNTNDNNNNNNANTPTTINNNTTNDNVNNTNDNNNINNDNNDNTDITNTVISTNTNNNIDNNTNINTNGNAINNNHNVNTDDNIVEVNEVYINENNNINGDDVHNELLNNGVAFDITHEAQEEEEEEEDGDDGDEEVDQGQWEDDDTAGPATGGIPHGVGDRFSETAHLQKDEIHKNCNCEIGQQDKLVTTLISHQTVPYVKKFLDIFPNLKYLMLNGIYFEMLPISTDMTHDMDRVRLVYDDFDYPSDYS